MASSELQVVISAIDNTKSVIETIRQEVAALRTALAQISGQPILDLSQGVQTLLDANGNQIKALGDNLQAIGKVDGGSLDDLAKGVENVAGVNPVSLRSLFESVQNLSKIQATGLAETNDELRRLRENSDEAGKSLFSLTKISETLGGGFGKLLGWVRFLTGGFLAIQGVGLAKHLADVAARAEVMGTVLNVVGKNAGYTSIEINNADRAVQKLGITAESSRQSLTTLMQAGLNISLAAPLARASQDLAVISGWSSSETFKRMIINIQQLDTLGLRWMGIMIDKEKVFADAEKAAGAALDDRAKKMVFANAVLLESTKLTGIYEASMDNVSKMLGSMARVTETFKAALGQGFLPVYTALVEGSMKFIEALTKMLDGATEGTEVFNAFGERIRDTSAFMNLLVKAIELFFDLLTNTIQAIDSVLDAFNKLGVAGEAILVVLGSYAVLLPLIIKMTAGAAAAQTTWAGVMLATSVTIAGAMLKIRLAAAAMWLAVSGPVGLAVAGIALVTGGIYALWQALKGSTDNSEKAVDDYLAKANKAAELQKELQEVTRQWVEAQNLSFSAVDADVRAAAAIRAKELEKQVNDLKKKLNEVSKEVTQARKEVEDIPKDSVQGQRIVDDEQRRSDAQRAENERIETLKALKKIYDDLGLSYTETEGKATLSTKSVVDSLNQIRAGIQNLGTVGADVEPALTQFFDKIAQASRNAVTETDRAAVDKAFAEWTKKAVEQGVVTEQQAKKSIETRKRLDAAARDETLRAVLAGGQDALAQGRAITAARLDMTRSQVEAEINIRRAGNDLANQVDQVAFNEALISAEEYFDRRRERLEQASEDEVLLIEAKIREQEGKLATIGNNPAARIQALNQLEALRSQLSIAEINRKKRELDLEREYNSAVRSRIELLRDASLAILEDLDEYSAKLAQINLQYQKDLEASGGVGVELLDQRREIQIRKMDRERAVSARDLSNELMGYYDSEQASINKIIFKYDDLREKYRNRVELQETINRLQQEEIEKYNSDKRIADLQRELSLRESILSLNQATVNLMQSRGQLTGLEAQAERNAIILERIQNLYESIALDEQRRQELIAKGTPEAIRQADQLTLSLQNQRKAVLDLTGQYRTLADEFRNTFAQEVNNVLDSIVFKTEKLSDAIKKAVRSFGDSILRTITTEWSQQITKSIAKIGADEKGNGGVFSWLSDLISPKKEPDLIEKSKTTPMRVEVANQPKVPETPKPQEGPAPGVAPQTTSTKREDGTVEVSPVQAPSAISTPIYREENPAFPVESIYGQGSPFDFDTGGTEETPPWEMGPPIPQEVLNNTWDELQGSIKTGAEQLTQDVQPGGDIFQVTNGAFTALATTIGGLIGSLLGGGGKRGKIGGILGSLAGIALSSYFGAAAGPVIQPFAEGGVAKGPGTGTSDSILALVSDGEHIMPAEKTRAWLPVLEAIRTGVVSGRESLVQLVSHLPRFAEGGVVSMPEMPSFQMPVLDMDRSSAPVAAGGDVNVAVTINSDLSTNKGNSPKADNLDKLGKMMGSMIQQEIARQKRPGGLLYE